MASHKLALIRYKTIDDCLQNRFRKWTLEDLMKAVSDALFEKEGIHDGVSKRTIQLDIQIMRSDKLGYNAPIVVQEKKYYTYAEKNYSIKNVPVTQQDLNTLSEAVDVLRQFKGFGYFGQLSEMVTKLEDKLYQEQHHGRSFIQFDHNDQVKGIEHIDGLHKAIIQRKVVRITYQSFKARQASEMLFYPCLLKEFRNRWFLLGVKKSDNSTLNLALDRIQKFEIAEEERYPKGQLIDIKNYYKDAIGVTVNDGQKPMNVIFSVPKQHAPYVITKPFHPSQKVISETGNQILFSMKVVHNFELEKELLAMGETLVVLGPNQLRRSMKKRLENAVKRYDEPIVWLDEEKSTSFRLK